MKKQLHRSTKEIYKDLLKNYIETEDEKYLYRADQISKSFIKDNILPEEIVNLHNQSLLELFPDLPHSMQNSLFFLLETMISYGLAYREYQALREEQLALRSEISVAASMQDTFLHTEKPSIDNLDIGVISIPAHQMNGDYHHFIKDEKGSLGVALADVVGKGVPAALCMSMIKYSLDSFPITAMQPNKILEHLNHVVERNIDPNMFITMFYAQYMPETGIFRYASAGHEPGFYYDHEKETFTELTAKGIVLGVSPEVKYEQKEIKMKKGDFVLILTDGVTECRKGDRFLERDEVLDVIRLYMHLPAQQLVNAVYKHFERLQNFQLRDDFTLIILKK